MNIKKDKLRPFSAKQITPKGWLRNQLETQMNGLTGNLHLFWPDIKDSAWIGGSSDSWERVPYWLDGFIPLSYLLDDKKAIKVVKFYIKSIVDNQHEDGWIAPGKQEDRAKYDVWGVFIALKALLGYAEITHEKKIYECIYKALKALDSHIGKYPLFDWAKQRWFECLIPLYAVYSIYKEEWLLDLAKKLHDQGFDFLSYYENELPKKKYEKGKWDMIGHTVNNVMAVKCYALYAKLTGDNKLKKKSAWMLKLLNKYHGTCLGQVSGDEMLAGLNPQQGTELCATVELMYSLEILTRIEGRLTYQGQLERLAFNALPSSLTNDMWAHQYDNQVNAPFIKRNDVNLWTTNGPESNIYGLEPHFGCCTANFHQGWPKFACSSIYSYSKGVLVASYVPLVCENKKTRIEVMGNYPFGNSALIKIDAKKPLVLRLAVPSWATAFKVNGETQEVKRGETTLSIESGHHEIQVEFEREPRFIKRPGGRLCLVDGPIVYALKVESRKVRINENDPAKALPHGDFEFHAESPFAYRIASKKLKIGDFAKILENSPFVTEVSPKPIYVEVEPIAYKEIGNYIKENPNVVTGEKQYKEFAPIGIWKCHMGELFVAKEEK